MLELLEDSQETTAENRKERQAFRRARGPVATAARVEDFITFVRGLSGGVGTPATLRSCWEAGYSPILALHTVYCLEAQRN